MIQAVDLLRAYRPPVRPDLPTWMADHEARCAALEARTGAARFRRGAEIKRANRGRLWMAVHEAEAYLEQGNAVLLHMDGRAVVL